MFDRFWEEKAELNENFSHPMECKRRRNYNEILDEIENNPNHEIAYPVISWVNRNNIKMSQGRHRIRAIIDSGANSIQMGIKKEHIEYLKGHLEEIKIIKELSF